MNSLRAKGVMSFQASSAVVLSISENWGFAMFETERYKLVVDEDALTACQLFDLVDDPCEDDNLLPDATRAFWLARGFIQLDTIDPLPGWPPGNPAAILAMTIWFFVAAGSPLPNQ